VYKYYLWSIIQNLKAVTSKIRHRVNKFTYCKISSCLSLTYPSHSAPACFTQSGVDIILGAWLRFAFNYIRLSNGSTETDRHVSHTPLGPGLVWNICNAHIFINLFPYSSNTQLPIHYIFKQGKENTTYKWSYCSPLQGLKEDHTKVKENLHVNCWARLLA